jgi:CubicO group peptidase (beta-lactamase class C family)
MNKMFTAVAIAQLAQAGKLHFTDALGNCLTDYPNADVASKVSTHQLRAIFSVRNSRPTTRNSTSSRIT